ncbi:DUF4339 domain-containing protein [Prosthecobacter sp.]|uniref:DUF4339 domain-containing protein n=1 Tax=Prosthecobacter sp. TaxID=1965333 RepID=UPI00378520D5
MPNYYLHLNGQVQGPYTELELQNIHADQSLAPDVQVCAEGGSWAAYTSLFPATSPALVQTPPADFNPYQAPQANIVVERADAAPQSYPGIGRAMYFLLAILINVAAAVMQAASKSIGVGIFVGLFALVPLQSRLKNIGRHPAWCLLGIVPLVSLFVTIPALLLPAGYQQHRTLDIPAKIIASLCMLVLVLVVIGLFVR